MRSYRFACLAMSGALAVSGAAVAQTENKAGPINDAPLTERWSPSEWGPDDRIGAINRTTPELVLQASTLIKQGKTATLGKIYASDMPTYGDRKWRFSITNLPPTKAWGQVAGVALDDHVEAAIGQVGTQFDGPGHMGVNTSKGFFFYNGRYLTDPGIGKDGLGPMGVEHVAQKGFVCRGVLLDAVGLRGGPLPVPAVHKKGSVASKDPGIVTAADIDAMIARQGIDPIKAGDCVFLHTGHGDLWHPSDWDTYSPEEKARRVAAFQAGEPGFGSGACEYLADRKVMLTGADNWSMEAFEPAGTGERGDYLECHVVMQARHGIWNIENLDLSQLVRDKAYEFLFVWAPLKIKGGTGSPGNPMALY